MLLVVLQRRHTLLFLYNCVSDYVSASKQKNLLIWAASMRLETSTEHCCSRCLWTYGKIGTFLAWFKRTAQKHTCAGIVIDPDVSHMADAHEGARGVNAHGVLPAVVLPFSALVDIWGEGREKEKGRTKMVKSISPEQADFMICQLIHHIQHSLYV